MAVPSKKIKLCENDQPSSKLENFKKWLESENFKINSKVSIAENKCVAKYGMVANEDIPANCTLFTIPRTSILSPENCSISDLLMKEKDALKSNSQWVSLITALAHEYLTPNSRWRPYLDLFPDKTDSNHPMFWNEEMRNSELAGTGIINLIQKDLENIDSEYKEIFLPFIEKYSSNFSDEVTCEKIYKKIVSFIMAYSFTEPILNEEDEQPSFPAPIMVPLADLLNHISDNNANLDYRDEELVMISTKSINKGEEIFNTYGELANSQLLHMYGFSERHPANKYDAVLVPMSSIIDEFKENKSSNEKALIDEKWQFLIETELDGIDDFYAFGPEGVLSEEELFRTLKVLFMSKTEFEDHTNKDGWSDDEDESDIMSNEVIPELPESWRELITKILNRKLNDYETTLSDDEKLLSQESEISDRQKWALYVRHGHKQILHSIIDKCKSSS